MILSQLDLYNFRRFKSIDGKPGLSVSFHDGLNALIGENDSGKTAIIDALKLVLLTQSNEYIRPMDDDFYQSVDGDSANEFCIECTLTDFSQDEAKNFIEYLTFAKVDDDFKYYLKLYYRAWKENRIYSELRVGDIDDGIAMDGKARDLLKAVYLKPLRDAEREMSSGRGSRISQIMLNHPAFKGKKEHELLKIFQKANSDIENYFLTDSTGRVILETIRNNLQAFNNQEQPSEVGLKTSEIRLKAILESLSLSAPEVQPGLGELNLLFIAAELLLLKDDNDGGIRLALIEELEAHLHPQAQLRLITFLQNEYNENNVQIIISTHSPVLASKINLKNLILMKNGCGYDLAEGKTRLEKGDYLFLQRFLDATKANLFFAKGIIMVEGDAENILVPIIAEILGYPLEKYGISVVNVGGTSFLRYCKIMIRADGTNMGIPVAVVTDCDVIDFLQNICVTEENALKLVGTKKTLAGPTTPSAQKFRNALNDVMMQNRIIRYQDAFLYAQAAIKALPDTYRELFDARFRFVFVDEYQDCNLEQREVLSKLFDTQNSTVFRIGDVLKKDGWNVDDIFGREFTVFDLNEFIKIGRDDENFNWERRKMPDSYYQDLLQFRINHYRNNGFGVHAIFRDGHLIGQMGLQVFEEDQAKVEYVIFLGKDYVNQGIGTKILTYLFNRCAEEGISSV